MIPRKNPRIIDNYIPSPPVNRTYSGPAIPAAYDPNWQLYNNLTADQIARFQAQPEWQNFVSWVALSPSTATVNADVTEATISAALGISKSKLINV